MVDIGAKVVRHAGARHFPDGGGGHPFEVVSADSAAELARLLQLDPETTLFALEDKPVPVELIREFTPLAELVAQGINSRPEIAEYQALLEANRNLLQTERFRPFIPSLHVGVSAGGFGGGVNDSLSQLDGRSDVDVLAVWELENLGFGTRAARQERSSQFRQTLLASLRIRDQIATEVTQAYHQVHAQRRQIVLAESNIKEAWESYEQNMARIRGLEGLPVEVLQAVQALAQARDTHLNTIVAYNQAQLRLLRAIGRSIEESARPSP